jgi:hypothetical protein
MKINYSVILIFITLLLICFRVPQSDIIDYLVFANIKYEISLTEFLLFFNKDFLFFTTLYIIPLSGFLLLFSIEFFAKYQIFKIISRKINFKWGLAWFFFPLTLDTSFHLLKQNLSTAFLFMAFYNLKRNKRILFSLFSFFSHLGSTLYFPSLLLQKYFYLGISLLAILMFYFVQSASIDVSYISILVLVLAIILLYYNKNTRKISINSIIIVLIFFSFNNSINAIRYLYFLIPFVFITIGNKYKKYSNLALIISFLSLILHFFFVTDWNYDLINNIFNFSRKTYSLDVIYE